MRKMAGRKAIHQTNGAMMSNLKTLGKFTHGEMSAAGEALNGKQGLMLFGSEGPPIERLSR